MSKGLRKIYVVGGGYHYANWMQGDIVDEVKNSDLVLFTGGEDIDPSIYGKKKHLFTYTNLRRDKHELKVYEEARELGKKLIGICRGAQLLCALAGGTLVQHQSHPHIHKMQTMDGQTIKVTSSHHQRQYPWSNKNLKWNLIGWANNLSPYNEGEDIKDRLDGHPEVEMAVYPTINALAIQAHPEWAYIPIKRWELDFVNFCRTTLNTHMVSKYEELAA